MDGMDRDGTWLGRAWVEGVGPCVVTLRHGVLWDITSKAAPTVRDVLERADAADDCFPLPV